MTAVLEMLAPPADSAVLQEPCSDSIVDIHIVQHLPALAALVQQLSVRQTTCGVSTGLRVRTGVLPKLFPDAFQFKISATRGSACRVARHCSGLDR